MADPVVHLTNGVPDSGTGNITTLGAVVTALGTPMQASGGSVTANAGTNLNTSALALETGGNLAAAASVLGVTTGTAVTTSATGTIQQYLRGVVSLLVSGITVATHAVTQSGSWVISAGSALIGKVGIDQTTDGTTNKVAADLRVAGSPVATGSGANGSTVPRVALATDSPGIIATGTAGSPSTVVLSVQGVASGTAQPISGTVSITDISNGEYETVAASQTDQALGATGATGDWLEGLLIVPATAAGGAVSIKDGSGSGITVFAGGGTTALPTLAPIYVPLGMKSTSGAWKVTTGTNVSAIGIGNFT